MAIRIAFTIFSLLAAAVCVAQSAGELIDLTGAAANKFKSQVGHTVILRGRLEDGKEGLVLVGAANDVSLYVIPEMPPSGAYSYPKTWTQLRHLQVRITGELRFRSFERVSSVDRAGRSVQVPPDYFYMVLQQTKIERVDSK